MDLHENADEALPFLDSKAADEPQPSTIMKLWHRFFGLFVAVAVGIYAGIVSRTLQESWIYSTIFCTEALACAAISVFLKTYTLKKAITGFTAYFLISAFLAPCSSWTRDWLAI
jgi:energy-converting hydrogenase Eha subunit A